MSAYLMIIQLTWKLKCFFTIWATKIFPLVISNMTFQFLEMTRYSIAHQKSGNDFMSPYLWQY